MRVSLKTAVACALALTVGNVAMADTTKLKPDWAMQGDELEEAMTLKGDKDRGRDIYEVCAACHMPEGWGLPDGTFPQLAGQHHNVLVKQLADIRAGNRDNPTMYPFALPSQIGGAQAVADVVEYMATLPMTPENGVGPGTDLELGKQLYEDNCVRCHGAEGEGNDAEFYPKIHGQHYEYIKRQFREIRDGARRNANPDMVEQVKGFSDRDLEAVSDYTSRIKPPADRLGPPGWLNPDFD
ncbi:MAG: c-type cytochrome [Thiohalomonadaceae bacterium]